MGEPGRLHSLVNMQQWKLPPAQVPSQRTDNAEEERAYRARDARVWHANCRVPRVHVSVSRA